MEFSCEESKTLNDNNSNNNNNNNNKMVTIQSIDDTYCEEGK